MQCQHEIFTDKYKTSYKRWIHWKLKNVTELYSVHTSKDWLNVSVQFYKIRASMQSQSNSQQALFYKIDELLLKFLWKDRGS